MPGGDSLYFLSSLLASYAIGCQGIGAVVCALIRQSCHVLGMCTFQVAARHTCCEGPVCSRSWRSGENHIAFEELCVAIYENVVGRIGKAPRGISGVAYRWASCRPRIVVPTHPSLEISLLIVGSTQSTCRAAIPNKNGFGNCLNLGSVDVPLVKRTRAYGVVNEAHADSD